MSIELVEGKVHLTFELGSGPLTLTSTKAYNTGLWYKIALQRNKRKGIVLIRYIFIYSTLMLLGYFSCFFFLIKKKTDAVLLVV